MMSVLRCWWYIFSWSLFLLKSGKALGPEVGDVELVIFSGQLVEAALKVVGFSMIFNPRAFEGYIHILEYLYMYICIYIYIAIYIDAYKYVYLAKYTYIKFDLCFFTVSFESVKKTQQL